MIKRQPRLPRFMAGGETNPLGARDVSRQLMGYENFLPEASFPVIPTRENGEAAGALFFFLFFSALGFFFSRPLLNWPFAILSSLCLRDSWFSSESRLKSAICLRGASAAAKKLSK